MKEGEEETHHLRELVVKRALPVPTNDTLEELRGRDAGRPPCGDEFACTPSAYGRINGNERGAPSPLTNAYTSSWPDETYGSSSCAT
jgi:hypothetical protein